MGALVRLRRDRCGVLCLLAVPAGKSTGISYLFNNSPADRCLFTAPDPEHSVTVSDQPSRIRVFPEVIAARLARACEESEGIENYDYLVVNDTVDHASALIDQLICDEQSQNTGRDQEYRDIC